MTFGDGESTACYFLVCLEPNSYLYTVVRDSKQYGATPSPFGYQTIISVQI